MENVTRFGVSIENDLNAKFNSWMKRHGYENRSEAIRALIRDRIAQEEWEAGKAESIGSVTIVYDHEESELSHKLTKVQHHDHGHTVASMHVHIDKHNCLEVVVLRGKADEVRHLADHITSKKGVKHSATSFTTISAIS